MCSGNKHECVLTIEINKPLETYEHIVGNSWAIFPMVSPNFYVVIVVMSGDVVNPIFCITLVIFVEVLPKDSCYGL